MNIFKPQALKEYQDCLTNQNKANNVCWAARVDWYTTMSFGHDQTQSVPDKRKRLTILWSINSLLISRTTYMSSLEFISSEKVSNIVVIASFAVFCVKSKAPVIIVVSS